MAELAALNINERQILANYPDDAGGFFWHHRVCLLRVTAARWVTLTPDGDLEILDLSVIPFRALERGRPFPADIRAECYVFDELTAADLSAAKRRAKLQADLLHDGMVIQDEAVWVFATPGAKLGREVPPALLGGRGDEVVYLNTKGVVRENEEEHFIELVPKAGLADWTRARQGGGDLRLIGTHRDAGGKRHLEFRAALELSTETVFEDWPHQGPRATREFLSDVRDGPGDLVSYHLAWRSASGVAENSSVCHDHRVLLEAVRVAMTYDQVNVANSAAFEHIIRRVLQHERAVERDPRRPDYTGLEMVLGAPVREKGQASTRKFRQWISEQNQADAVVMKQARLLREERAAEAKRRAEAKKNTRKKQGNPGDETGETDG